MTDPRTPPPIELTQIPTSRVATAVRYIRERQPCEPVVLLPGLLGSSAFFTPLMEQLPRRYRPLALDLRGYGGTDPEPVDATRGVRDFADDIVAALDALELARAHVIGWSLGGAVAWQLALAAPERVSSLTLLAPISPFGLGGTVDVAGTLAAPDGAGSGAGLIAREFVASLVNHDLAASVEPLFAECYVTPEWDGEAAPFTAAMAALAVGAENFPGNQVPSAKEPGFAPGPDGVLNAIAPTNLNLAGFAEMAPGPAVLWVRGEADRVISDDSVLLPPDVTAQPMVAQTRAVLTSYAANGGAYREVVLPGVAHCPHLENVPLLLESLIPHLDGATRA